MSVDQILVGVGAIVTAAAGVWLAVHEARRRERQVNRKEIDELVHHVDHLSKLLVEQSDEVEALTKLLLEQRRWIYKVSIILIDHGIDVPQPPAPSFDRDEYEQDE